MEWERPSERVRELIRQGAEMVVNGSQDWLDNRHNAQLTSEYMQYVNEDPVLAEAVRRSNRSNQLHWAAANISHPGEPVPPNPEEESLAFVHHLVRRGVDESVVVDSFRAGQSAAWENWMAVAVTFTADPGEVRELLDVTARSIAEFVDVTVDAFRRQWRIERDRLTGTQAELLEVVALIRDGAPIAQQHAENRLGYRLEQSHTAAVIWGDESTSLSELDRATEALVRGVGGRRSLSVLADAATRWVWLPGAPGPDLAGLTAAVQQWPGVRIAVGPTAAGIEGFRTSHLDAITTQRMMARLGSTQRVASFADVELVALITADPGRANRFIKHVLGGFASADPELQRTVLTFIREQCNASPTADRLFTHRNTVLRRIARAEKLLPRPLEDTSVHVAVALEALAWLEPVQLP